MNQRVQEALDWALNRNIFHSVAADYARVLGEFIRSVGDIEKNYPNWEGRFSTIAEAVSCHTGNQDAVIVNMQKRLSGWPKVTREEIYHACNGMTAVVRDILAILRRIGVDVMDEPPAHEADPGTAGDGGAGIT